MRPDNPDIVYVGAIGSSPGGGNSLQRYDRKRDQIRLITTWPEGDRGNGASEHKYRFAWTYPIVISPHDPEHALHRRQPRLQIDRRGAELAADQPRSDPRRSRDAGADRRPGQPRRHRRRDLRDRLRLRRIAARGRRALGRDPTTACSTSPATAARTGPTSRPSRLPEWALISCIELSPFDAGTAYVAATRYKLDDYEPYLFVTRDYGKTWRRINNGIPADDFTRVIRADPARKGLLYAGTETGIYVSFDDGANWQRFQLNLPVAPIHEILVKGSDLIAGTHGRSIWILDDLTPLRAVAAGEGQPTHLFAPRLTTRVLPGVDWTDNVPGWTNYLGSVGSGFLTEVTPDGENRRTYLDAGENPPRGAIIAYSLAEAPAEPISLVIRNAKGEEIRTFTSRKEDDPPKAKELRAPANAGGNRFVWDLRHAPITKIEGTDPMAEEPIPGPFVAAGRLYGHAQDRRSAS